MDYIKSLFSGPEQTIEKPFPTNLQVGDRCQVRDMGEVDRWHTGTVESLSTLEGNLQIYVRPDGYENSYTWDDMRPIPFDIESCFDDDSLTPMDGKVKKIKNKRKSKLRMRPTEYLITSADVRMDEAVQSVIEWEPERLYADLKVVAEPELREFIQTATGPYKDLILAAFHVFGQDHDVLDLMDTLTRIMTIREDATSEIPDECSELAFGDLSDTLSVSRAPSPSSGGVVEKSQNFCAPLLLFEAIERIKLHFNLPTGMSIKDAVDEAISRLDIKTSTESTIRQRIDAILSVISPTPLLLFEACRYINRNLNLDKQLTAAEIVAAAEIALCLSFPPGFTFRQKIDAILSEMA